MREHSCLRAPNIEELSLILARHGKQDTTLKTETTDVDENNRYMEASRPLGHPTPTEMEPLQLEQALALSQMARERCRLSYSSPRPPTPPLSTTSASEGGKVVVGLLPLALAWEGSALALLAARGETRLHRCPEYLQRVAFIPTVLFIFRLEACVHFLSSCGRRTIRQWSWPRDPRDPAKTACCTISTQLPSSRKISPCTLFLRQVPQPAVSSSFLCLFATCACPPSTDFFPNGGVFDQPGSPTKRGPSAPRP